MKKKLVIIMDIVFAIVLAAVIHYEFGVDDIREVLTAKQRTEAAEEPDADAVETLLEPAVNNVGVVSAPQREASEATDQYDYQDAYSYQVTDQYDYQDAYSYQVTDQHDYQDAYSYQDSYQESSQKQICMVGDSRFVGMHEVVGDRPNITWIAKDGMGHAWYWDNRSEISLLDRDTVIVYELGINSLSPRDGIEALEDIRDLGFYEIYALTLGDVDEVKEASHGYHVTDEQVVDYNYYLKNHLPYGVKLLDSYSALYDNFYSVDGLHYSGDTYRMWFEMILNEVEGSTDATVGDSGKEELDGLAKS